MSGPRERWVSANRLRHHLLEWGDAGRQGSPRDMVAWGGSPLLLLHGFLEHAYAWERTAPRLAAAGLHVFALDFRGHGDSDRVGPGGYYHFADYAADLAGVVRALGGRAALVGHSMGASAALLYAGTEPERVTALVCVDGLGPPDTPPALAPERFERWIEGLERVAGREPFAVVPDDAVARLAARFPRLPEDAVRALVAHNTRRVDGRVVWKFDPLHQTTSPQPYYVAQAEAFWRRIACPVLFVEGGASDLRLDEADTARRLAALRAERVTIQDAGHHPHLETPAALAEAVVRFLAR
jgi:pimeloyl-ACP methyl ester carboxylesterase